MLERLARPASSETDHLFVGTDRFTYFTLSWDRDTEQLRTEREYVDLADNSSRESQVGDRCLIDPSGRFMTLELYEGVVTVVPIIQQSHKKGRKPALPLNGLQVGQLGEPAPVRIEELSVRSSGFLHCRPDSPPRLALLYEDTQGAVKVKVRELSYSPGSGSDAGPVADLKVVDVLTEELEMGASILIPVPAPPGKILYFSLRV